MIQRTVDSIAVIIMSVISIISIAYAQDIFVSKDGSIRNIDARALITGRDASYLATKSAVYMTKDMKDDWQAVFSVPSGSYEINCLTGKERTVFVGTQKGLFRSEDFGRTWQNVFKTSMPEKNDVLCIRMADIGGLVYIGTARGLFQSEDLGGSWKDISGTLKESAVKSLAIHKGAMYAGTDKGIYVKRPDAQSWERVVIKSIAENAQADEVAEDVEQDAGEDEYSGLCYACVVATPGRLYAGMDKQMLYSEDEAASWRPFPSTGLGGTINAILPSPRSGKVYCATTKGVFQFIKEDGTWHELYKGKDKRFMANDIIFEDASEKNLWAITDSGAYKFAIGEYAGGQMIDIERNIKTLKITFDAEPPFRDLQRAAMKFAEVEPEKIAKWRKEARLKALVPKITAGIDRDQGNNNEIYTSATTKYIIEGPDDVSNGWDVAVSWDLSALIFSDDQTNIDVRSRLTTQLRNDILDDLRRAYFERKRLQYELIAMPPKDPKLLFEKELRIQELTQAIDDLTGNYLSDHIIKSNNLQ